MSALRKACAAYCFAKASSAFCRRCNPGFAAHMLFSPLNMRFSLVESQKGAAVPHASPPWNTLEISWRKQRAGSYYNKESSPRQKRETLSLKKRRFFLLRVRCRRHRAAEQACLFGSAARTDAVKRLVQSRAAAGRGTCCRHQNYTKIFFACPLTTAETGCIIVLDN